MPIVASKLVEIFSNRFSLGIMTKRTSRRNKKYPNMRLGGACRKIGNSKLPSSGSAAHCTSADRRSSQKYDIRHAMWPCTARSGGVSNGVHVTMSWRWRVVMSWKSNGLYDMPLWYMQDYSNMPSTNQDNTNVITISTLIIELLYCSNIGIGISPCLSESSSQQFHLLAISLVPSWILAPVQSWDRPLAPLQGCQNRRHWKTWWQVTDWKA